MDWLTGWEQEAGVRIMSAGSRDLLDNNRLAAARRCMRVRSAQQDAAWRWISATITSGSCAADVVKAQGVHRLAVAPEATQPVLVVAYRSARPPLPANQSVQHDQQYLIL